jgi:hypothetical protein
VTTRSNTGTWRERPRDLTGSAISPAAHGCGRSRHAGSGRASCDLGCASRQRGLLQHGPPKAKKEVPTLETFAPRFVDGHARANRHKPSGINAVESILRWHLVPALGAKRLDAISNEQVQRLKLELTTRAPKTVNNVLTVLSTLLKKAVEGGRDRAAAVRDQVVAQSEEDDGVSRFRSVRPAADGRAPAGR